MCASIKAFVCRRQHTESPRSTLSCAVSPETHGVRAWVDGNPSVWCKHRLNQHFSIRTLTTGNFLTGFFQERCAAVRELFLHTPVTKKATAQGWDSSSLWSRESRNINKTSGLLQQDYYKWFSWVLVGVRIREERHP